MIETLRRNPVTAALAVACATLAAIVALELFLPGRGASSGSPKKAAPAEAKLLPPIAVASVEQLYPETVDRPLWIPTRRPAPSAVTAPAAAFPPGQYILQGVIVAGGTRVAMLKEKASGKIHRVEKGRDLNGIQVAEVEPESVTLAQGDQREVIDLRVQRPGAPGTPGAPPTPASASTSGPFAAVPRQQAAGVPAAAQPTTSPQVPAPTPGQPPAGSPFGSLPRPPQSSPGPLAPPTQSRAANAPVATVPQEASSAPMTPEELLARRRARRNQSP